MKDNNENGPNYTTKKNRNKRINNYLKLKLL